MSKTDETADFRHRRSVSSAWSTRTLNGGWTNHLEISFSGNPLTGVILIGRQRMGEGFAFGQMALDAASYLPARRASRVDPNVALRHL